MKRIFSYLGMTILLADCSAQRIACCNETTGMIHYVGGFDNETSYKYVVDVVDGVRDFYQKKSCQSMIDAEL